MSHPSTRFGDGFDSLLCRFASNDLAPTPVEELGVLAEEAEAPYTLDLPVREEVVAVVDGSAFFVIMCGTPNLVPSFVKAGGGSGAVAVFSRLRVLLVGFPLPG